MSSSIIANPQVSIVCAWYNRVEHITETIDSLLAQRYDSFEIIIINDGSKDPLVREVLDKYQDHRIHIVHQENAGFVKSIQRAIDLSKGKFIAIQGAGDVAHPDRIKLQSDFLLTHLDHAVVCCKCNQVVVGGPAHGNTVLIGTPGDHSLNEFLIQNNPFAHGAVMFRRETYFEVGGYRSFFQFAQDRDLWIRMAEKKKLHLLDDILYDCRIFSKDGVSASKDKLFLQKALSTFAIQCHYDRQKYGRDFIDEYGELGGLFRKPNAMYAKYLANLSLQSIFSGETNSAIKFTNFSINEKVGAYVIAIFLTVQLCSRSIIISNIVRKILSLHSGSEKWKSRN